MFVVCVYSLAHEISEAVQFVVLQHLEQFGQYLYDLGVGFNQFRVHLLGTYYSGLLLYL